jgi:hypothetical protein
MFGFRNDSNHKSPLITILGEILNKIQVRVNLC